MRRRQATEWFRQTVERAVDVGLVPEGRRITTHTLRHSYARHILASGVPINNLSRWLGHSPLQLTLVYLELLPDPEGSLAKVPQVVH